MHFDIQLWLDALSQVSPWVICLFFFLSGVLQIILPPYPGDTLLIAGGYLGSVVLSSMNIPILLTFWLGTLASSLALYELGVWKGEAVLGLGLIRRYFPDRLQKKAKAWIIKYGIVTLLFCKFIPGLNSLIIMFGGIFRYSRPMAVAGVTLASLVHNLAFFFVGKAIGNNLENITGFLRIYNRTAIVMAVICGIGLLAVYLWKKYKRTGEA